MSSNEMSRALLGFGLPPAAPMSPPAQLTRMCTGPSFSSMVFFIAATAALSPILPLTAQTRPPWRSISLGHDGEIGRLAIFGGRGPMDVVDRDVGAEFGQTFGHHAPEAAPGSRHESRLAGEFLGHASLLIGVQAERAHVGGAAADHGEFVLGDRGVLALLPGRAEIGVVGEAVDARGREARGEVGGGFGWIEVPPFRPQEAHMPRLQRARLQHCGQLLVMRAQQVEQRSHGHGAVADRAAHEPIALVGELDAVILEMEWRT